MSSIRVNCSDTVHDMQKVKATDNQDTRLRDTDSRVAGEGKDREKWLNYRRYEDPSDESVRMVSAEVS